LYGIKTFPTVNLVAISPAGGIEKFIGSFPSNLIPQASGAAAIDPTTSVIYTLLMETNLTQYWTGMSLETGKVLTQVLASPNTSLDIHYDPTTGNFYGLCNYGPAGLNTYSVSLCNIDPITGIMKQVGNSSTVYIMYVGVIATTIDPNDRLWVGQFWTDSTQSSVYLSVISLDSGVMLYNNKLQSTFNVGIWNMGTYINGTAVTADNRVSADNRVPLFENK